MEWLDHILLPDSEVRDEMDFVKKEVKIPAKIHKTLIGVGGKLIQTIMNKCGEVQIKFPESNSGSDVVTVCGPTDSVEKAVKLLKEMEIKAKPQHYKFLIYRKEKKEEVSEIWPKKYLVFT